MATQNTILSQQTGESIQGSFGGLPVAERNSTYIAYFQGIGGTGPEIIDQSAYFISYLIDEQGNIFNPLSEPSALNNLYQNFEVGKNTITSLELPTTNNSQLNGEYKITGVGAIEPILITETGSAPPDYLTSIDFKFGTLANADNYIFSTVKASNSTMDMDYTNIALGNILTNNNNFDQNTYISYSFDSPGDTVTGGTRVNFKTTIKCSNSGDPDLPLNQGSSFTVQIYNMDTEEVLATFDNYAPDDGTVINTSIETGMKNFNDNDRIAVRVKVTSFLANIYVLSGSTFSLTQEYSPTVKTASSTYWEIGDYNVNPTIITASTALSGLYNLGYRQTSSAEISDFGFNPINANFDNLKSGDKIRFEYNEGKKFNISEVLPGEGPGGRLCLKLDGQVPTGSELNHFILYRLKKDGKYVILDIGKNSGGTPGGILRPKYLPKSFEDNYDNILGILRDKGILKDSFSLGDITE
jgi:hypothetical protein